MELTTQTPNELHLPEKRSNQSLTQDLRFTKPAVKVNEHYEISLYTDKPANRENLLQAMGKLDAAFPNSFKNNTDKKRFYAVLAEMIADEQMTEKQLTDAVKYTIKHIRTYSQINIADIVSYDKRARLYTVDDVYNLTGRFPSPDFQRVERNGKFFWIKNTDLEIY